MRNQDIDIPIDPTEVLPPRKKHALREAVENVFWQMDGAEGMLRWVEESTVNRRIFYKDILPKMIPREMRGEITGADGAPMKMVIEWAGDSNTPQELVSTALSTVVSGVIQANNEEF